MQFVVFEIAHSIVVGILPKLIIDISKAVIGMLPDLMIEHHDEFGKVFVVAFPFLEGTVKGVADCVFSEGFRDGKIIPKGCDGGLANHFSQGPSIGH